MVDPIASASGSRDWRRRWRSSSPPPCSSCSSSAASSPARARRGAARRREHDHGAHDDVWPDGTTTTPGEGPCRRIARACAKDTLESIAARCEVDVDQIIELNRIDPLALSPARVRIRPPATQG